MKVNRLEERPVLLTHPDGQLRGVQFYEHAADLPPLVEAGGHRMYRYLWVERGWTIFERSDVRPSDISEV